jgi:hypothetical protein
VHTQISPEKHKYPKLHSVAHTNIYAQIYSTSKNTQHNQMTHNMERDHNTHTHPKIHTVTQMSKDKDCGNKLLTYALINVSKHTTQTTYTISGHTYKEITQIHTGTHIHTFIKRQNIQTKT